MPKGQLEPGIRPATGEDLAVLEALGRRTIDACYRGFLGGEAVDSFLDSGSADAHVRAGVDRGDAYCLRQDGEIVGFSILEGLTVDTMMVDPAHHRRGFGRVLLGHAEAVLFAEYAAIRLESFADNVRANAFYEACGWVRARRLDVEGFAKVEYTKGSSPA